VGSDDFAQAEKAGFAGYPGFKLSDRPYPTGVLQAFMRRMPPRSRSDFRDFLASVGLPADAVLSDFALLGYSEARELSDGFSIVNPFDGLAGPLEFVTEVAGYRYYHDDHPSPRPGAVVSFIPEPQNEYDPQAIAVRLDGTRVGHVNRLQTRAFHRWFEAGTLGGHVFRTNGMPNWPRLFLFVEVTAQGTKMPRAA
jgi:hypothetical protein